MIQLPGNGDRDPAGHQQSLSNHFAKRLELSAAHRNVVRSALEK
jgi:hypothetical protein